MPPKIEWRAIKLTRFRPLILHDAELARARRTYSTFMYEFRRMRESESNRVILNSRFVHRLRTSYLSVNCGGYGGPIRRWGLMRDRMEALLALSFVER